MSNSVASWTAAHQPPCPSPSPEICPSSRPLHQWCHPAISSSDAIFSFCPPSFLASGTFPMSLLFTSGTKIMELQLHHRSFQRVSSVQLLSCVQLFATPWTTACQASLSITNSGVYPNSCPLSRWCHPTISSSVIPFSSHPQSFPALGSFPMSQLFVSGGQSIGVPASTSVLPMNTQDWSPLGWIGWIFLQSRVFSNTTVQKHQFFSAQLSL